MCIVQRTAWGKFIYRWGYNNNLERIFLIKTHLNDNWKSVAQGKHFMFCHLENMTKARKYFQWSILQVTDLNKRIIEIVTFNSRANQGSKMCFYALKMVLYLREVIKFDIWWHNSQIIAIFAIRISFSKIANFWRALGWGRKCAIRKAMIVGHDQF